MIRIRRWPLRSTALVAAFITSSLLAAGQVSYPKTKRVDQHDTYHGTDVADPYRWLEDDARKSKEVADWVAAENEVTFSYLKAIPQRDAIKKRLTALWNYEKFTAPGKVAGRYFFSKNNGLQNQFVVFMQDSLKAEPKVLFDPNSWSKDGTVALSGTSFSDDGKYCAYAKSEAGSDWKKILIRDVDADNDLADVL